MVEYIITNPVSLALLGFAFCYFILYRFNKLLGNMGYVGVSIVFWGALSQTSTTITSSNGIGLILVIGSVLKLIWEAIEELRK